MVAVRSLLATLNSLAQSGLLASGWLRSAENERAAAPAGALPEDSSTELWTYARGGVEPPLDELLSDPVVRLMMRADRQDPEQLRRLLRAKRRTA